MKDSCNRNMLESFGIVGVQTLLIIIFSSLLFLLPTALAGYAGHDFEWYVTSWLEVRRSFISSMRYPLWANGGNFNLGDPRFFFYPPFPLVLGGLLSLAVPLRFVPAAIECLIALVAGLSMYLASFGTLRERDRLLAALAYMFSPYFVTTALIRFAVGELCVQALLPLLLAVFWRAINFRRINHVAALAVLLGLNWTTNIPISIAIFYVLLLTTLVCSVREKSAVPLILFVSAEFTSLALASFYLVPAIIQQKWIRSATLLDFDFSHFLIFSPISYFHLKLFNLSCWGFGMVGAMAIIIGLWSKKQAKNGTGSLTNFAMISLIAFFFQLRISYVLWNHLPYLKYVQFPFRFLPLIGVGVSFTLLSPQMSSRSGKILLLIITLMTIVPVIERFSLLPTSVYSPLLPRINAWQRTGFKSPPEYMSVWASNRPPDSDYARRALTVGSPDCLFRISQTEDGRKIVTTHSDSNTCVVLIPLYFYPYWTARDEKGIQQRIEVAAGGLIRLKVRNGDHDIIFIMEQTGRIRILFDAVSSFTAAVILLVMGQAVLKNERGSTKRVLRSTE